MRIAESSSLPSSSSPRGRDKEEKRAVISLFFSCFLHIIEIIRHPSLPARSFRIFRNGKSVHVNISDDDYFQWNLSPIRFPLLQTREIDQVGCHMSHFLRTFCSFVLKIARKRGEGQTNSRFANRPTELRSRRRRQTQSCRFYDKIFSDLLSASSLVKRHAINSLLVCISARNRV